jgi:NitT/TauT family transport system substrate-binding protein
MALIHTRRGFMGGIVAASASGLVCTPRVFAAEASLETTTVRLANDGGICFSPGIVEEMLRAEGFSDVRYVDMTGGPRPFASAGVDFKTSAAWDAAVRIDDAEPVESWAASISAASNYSREKASAASPT